MEKLSKQMGHSGFILWLNGWPDGFSIMAFLMSGQKLQLSSGLSTGDVIALSMVAAWLSIEVSWVDGNAYCA